MVIYYQKTLKNGNNPNIYIAKVGDAEITATYKNKELLTLEVKKWSEIKVVEPVGIKLSKYVYYHGEQEILNDENDEKWIKKESFTGEYSNGFLTFDSEGDDIENSRFFTRKPHVPYKEKNGKKIAIGQSGITIGRGLDLGVGEIKETDEENRKKELEKLKNIALQKIVKVSTNNRCKPIALGLKEWLVDSVTLKRELALKYMESLATVQGEKLLTRKQQFYLFHVIYPQYITTTANIMNKNYGVDIDILPLEIRNVLVDMTYVGQNSPTTRKVFCPLLLKDISNGKFNNFVSYIEKTFISTKDSRWEKRLEHIKKNKDLV